MIIIIIIIFDVNPNFHHVEFFSHFLFFINGKAKKNHGLIFLKDLILFNSKCIQYFIYNSSRRMLS